MKKQQRNKKKLNNNLDISNEKTNFKIISMQTTSTGAFLLYLAIYLTSNIEYDSEGKEERGIFKLVHLTNAGSYS